MTHFRIMAAALALGLFAQAPAEAAAKPKRCLSEAEIRAEQEVRHGIFLRESSNRCEGEYVTGVRKPWQEFQTRFGDRLLRANDKRTKAFQREFPEGWRRALTSADARIVTYHRHFPLTRAYCENVEALVKEVSRKGYGAFSTQAKTIQNEVIGDYRVCR